MASNDTAELLPKSNGTPYGSQRDSNTFSQYSAVTRSIRRVDPEPVDASDTFKGKRKCLVILKGILGFAFFLIVLVCSAASKVTLVSLANRLAYATNISALHRGDADDGDESSANSQSVRLYWYLFFVISLPNVLTFVRSASFGVLGKTRRTFPWPTGKATCFGLLFSALEVTAISVLVYVILPKLPPDISILVLNGVFVVQIAIDFYYTRSYCLRSSTRNEASSKICIRTALKLWNWVGRVLESKLTKGLALLLQIGGIIALAFYFGLRMHTYIAIVFPLTLLVLSFVWSNRTQEYITKTWKTSETEYNTARYKSSFINSAFRIVLYPFVSYAIFRCTYRIDPWCLDKNCNRIELVSPELAELITQILTSFLGYVFAWISCVMMLNWCGLALPLFLSTPISLVWYYTNLYIQKEHHHPVFPHFETRFSDIFDVVHPVAPSIAVFLWIGQILAMVYYIFNKNNIILANDSEMFLTPHYDGVFLEQHTILNRQTKKNKRERYQPATSRSYQPLLRKPRTIFICSTMYRENDTEMKQMLTSIYRVAQYCEDRKSKGLGVDNYESHIFFDGSINGTQLQPFALQLISLLEKTLKVKLSECRKIKTPYGFQLTWYLGMALDMRFTIHLKDRNKVKPKKRWSQVMYMNYIINHRIKEDIDLNSEDTFILTTDADIDFTAESAVVLLDMLASNKKVGAVSARTHPKGSGPLYWYQVFDYAIGHWFMKPAEHILGCVLCSPGCFSVFRCSALNEVISKYATDVTSASEFLTKDMGEDRWLCTLLIKKGWRLEYCAISEDQTYVPENFSEFYKQRRRWIPSTVANLGQLISEAGAITRNNDTISIPFIVFQALMVLSTAISPATVILIVATGLQSAYQLNSIATIVVLTLVSMLYGIICLCASPKTQIDVAKLLTFIFAVIMAIVIAGIFRDTIYDIFPDPKLTVVRAPDCSLFSHTSNNSKDYDDCMKNARYLGSLANSTASGVFKLPVSMTTIYLAAFAATFTIAAILHLPEWSCLIHSLWYLLALPSGYLFLLIYSAANLDSQSWGTREVSSGQDEGLAGWMKYIKMAWKMMYSRCCRKPENSKGEEELLTDEDSPSTSDAEATAEPSVTICYQEMNAETKEWLTDLGCDDYIRKFEEHGYTNIHYIAAMSKSDFEAIDIEKRGFRLRLEKAAKKLPSLPIDIDIPRNVRQWLRDLEMDEYTELFHREGYKTEDDIENLKDLSDAELKGIGVHKRAHLQRLRAALKSLFYPMPIELQKRKTKAIIENVATLTLDTSPEEQNFWECLIHKTLKPVTIRFTQVDDLQHSLRSLRNNTLAILLLVNIIWIILLHTLSFARLAIFSFDPRVFQLLFLAVYGVIIIIQFFAMICHRCVTLIHYLGRVNGEEFIQTDRDNEFVNITTTVVN